MDNPKFEMGQKVYVEFNNTITSGLVTSIYTLPDVEGFLYELDNSGWRHKEEYVFPDNIKLKADLRIKLIEAHKKRLKEIDEL